jgi:hypothetical protein
MGRLMNPLDEFANALIIFTLPKPGIYMDALGNFHAKSEDYPFRVYLKSLPMQSSTKVKEFPGIDQAAQELEGYCTAPSVLPHNVAPSNWYRCRYGVTHGFFYLKPWSNFGRSGIDVLVENEIGTHISGFFQVGRINN